MREDFHMRETLFLKEIDQEKAILKQEYTRLNDL